MPRNGSGVYSHPFPDVVEGTTIESAVFNGNTSDVEQDLNTPRPIVAGGTGANNAHDALVNLHGEESNQGPVTNYDTFPFVSGSFYSLPGATNAPDNPAGTSAHYFTGICYAGAGTITLEARDQNDTSKVYARVLNSGVWGVWVQQTASAADFVEVAGDQMTGTLSVSKTVPAGAVAPFFWLRGSYGDYASVPSIDWDVNQSGVPTARIGADINVTGFMDLVFYTSTNFTGTPGVEHMRLDGAGNLTVTSSIVAGGVSGGGTYYFGGGTAHYLSYDGTNFVMNGGDLYVGGNVHSRPTSTTGAFLFGNSGTKYLNYDGANFNMVGGALLLNSPFLYLSYAQAAGGQLNFGNAGTKYLQYDGTNFVMRGGPLYVQNSVGAAIAVINDGGTSFNGSISGAGISATRADGSYQYTLTYTSVRTWGLAVLASGSVSLDDLSAGLQRLQVDVNGYVKAGTGVQCKAGISGGYGTSVFNLMYAAGSTALWIDNTNFGNISVSDYRIKKDVIDLPGMWDTVKALRPIKYTQAQYTPQVEIVHRLKVAKEAREVEERAAKAEGREAKPAEQPQPMFPADDIERWGFIAHELQETLVPSASSGVKDDPNAIQSPNPFTVIAALTKALQEAMTRIEALEAAP